MPKLAVVIVDYRAKEKVERLIREIRGIGEIGPHFAEASRGEIIVIDNNKNNVGFAKGANIGIKKALENGAEKILLVNPDIKISDIGSISNIGRIGDIEGAVLKFKRRSKWVYDFGGRVNWRVGRTTHWEMGDVRDLGGMGNEIDYVSGACMMIDRRVFEKIGLFDERFFLYFEDADFCLRAKKAGFKVAVNPNIIVEHQIEEHRFSNDDFKFKLALESNKKFIFKWINPIFWTVAIGYLGGLCILRYLRKFKNDCR